MGVSWRDMCSRMDSGVVSWEIEGGERGSGGDGAYGRLWTFCVGGVVVRLRRFWKMSDWDLEYVVGWGASYRIRGENSPYALLEESRWFVWCVLLDGCSCWEDPAFTVLLETNEARSSL